METFFQLIRLGGRVYQFKYKTILDRKFTENKTKVQSRERGRHYYVFYHRKQTLFNRIISDNSPVPLPLSEGSCYSWSRKRVVKTYPLFLDYDKGREIWSAGRFFMVTKLQNDLEKRDILFGDRNRRRLITVDRESMNFEDRWRPKTPYFVKEVRVRDFSGAYKFMQDWSLSGAKELKFEFKNQGKASVGGEDEEKESADFDTSVEFLRVFNFKTRLFYGLSLSPRQFLSSDGVLDDGIKNNEKLDLFCSQSKTKFFAFTFDFDDHNPVKTHSEDNKPDATISKIAKVKHFEVNIENALTKECKDEERSMEIEVKLIKSIELGFKFDFESDLINKTHKHFRVDFKFRTLVLTERGEGLISFNDMEKLIRICEEYNETVEEESRIKIDRSDVRAPIKGYSYCLSADVMVIASRSIFNSPHVILIDNDCQDYVVISLRSLFSNKGEVAKLILDGVL